MISLHFNTLKKLSLSFFVSFLLTSSAYADCSYQLFSISSAKGISIEEFIDQISNECDYSVIITDPVANKIIQKNLQKTTLKNLTIDEVLNIVLIENNLNYTLSNNILKISYLITKTYQLDYLISKRTSKGSTDITLSSKTEASGGLMSGAGAASGGGSGGGNDSMTGIKIESEEEVKFWHELDLEFERVLNRPEDAYVADAPIINKNAGMVTVTATLKQLDRLNKYIDHLQDKMQKQVLIDVHMLLVTFNDSKTTGVDWAQLYALQNFKISGTYSENGGGVPSLGDAATTAVTSGIGITMGAEATLKEVVKFLESQGDVHTVSNPKILTLNNQPALITVGTEYFYKVQQSSNQQGSGGGVAATVQNDIVSSVFAGVLLDITPEISNNKTITLKINPSVSSTRQNLSIDDQGGRTMPPDLDRRQLASVVTVKDGARIILGGLISKNNTMKQNKVPLLGDIPGLGYLFKYEEEIVSTQELIVVIQPHIVGSSMSKLSLSELGYSRINPSLARTAQTLEESNTTK
ncbi:MAG: pilus (MSHA type) biogenesis protein MshL [Campylobacterota bacterium]|nr:pilus (MSHA type) biogenesis protein MshL [Campylobacterota bacterium]